MKKYILLLALICSGFGLNAQTKMAHVQTKTLIDTLPSQKKGVEELRFIQQKGVDEMKELEAAAMKAVEDYRGLDPNSSQAVKDYTLQRAQKAQENYENRRASIEQQLQMMSESLDASVFASVKEAVKIVAAKKGLNYVIDASSALYASGTDITNEVITELLRIDATKSAPVKTNTPVAGGK